MVGFAARGDFNVSGFYYLGIRVWRFQNKVCAGTGRDEGVS